jgi:hypothetical protein
VCAFAAIGALGATLVVSFLNEADPAGAFVMAGVVALFAAATASALTSRRIGELRRDLDLGHDPLTARNALARLREIAPDCGRNDEVRAIEARLLVIEGRWEEARRALTTVRARDVAAMSAICDLELGVDREDVLADARCDEPPRAWQRRALRFHRARALLAKGRVEAARALLRRLEASDSRDRWTRRAAHALATLGDDAAYR